MRGGKAPAILHRSGRSKVYQEGPAVFTGGGLVGDPARSWSRAGLERRGSARPWFCIF